MEETLNLTLKVWRQTGPNASGRFETYELTGISTDMSFLEMMDVLNEQLITSGSEPVEMESDCREGICGTCGCMINGRAHGSLDMNVKPKATEVWVDGTFRGTCDTFDGHPGKLNLLPGMHTLKLVTPEGVSVEHEIRVRANTEFNVGLDLRNSDAEVSVGASGRTSGTVIADDAVMASDTSL